MASVRDDCREYSRKTDLVLEWLVLVSQSRSLFLEPIHHDHGQASGQRDTKTTDYVYTGQQYKTMSAFLLESHGEKVVVPGYIIRDLKSAITLRIKTTQWHQESGVSDPESDIRHIHFVTQVLEEILRHLRAIQALQESLRSSRQGSRADYTLINGYQVLGIDEDQESAAKTPSSETKLIPPEARYKMQEEMEEREITRRQAERYYRSKVILPIETMADHIASLAEEDVAPKRPATQPSRVCLAPMPLPSRRADIGVVIQLAMTIADELQYEFDSRFGGLILDHVGADDDADFARPDLHQILVFLGHESDLSKEKLGGSTFGSRVRFLQAIKDRVGSDDPDSETWPAYLPPQAMNQHERRPGGPNPDLIDSYRAHRQLGPLLLEFMHLDRCCHLMPDRLHGPTLISPVHAEVAKIWYGPRAITIGAWLATGVMLRTQTNVEVSVPGLLSIVEDIECFIRAGVYSCLLIKMARDGSASNPLPLIMRYPESLSKLRWLVMDMVERGGAGFPSPATMKIEYEARFGPVPTYSSPSRKSTILRKSRCLQMEVTAVCVDRNSIAVKSVCHLYNALRVHGLLARPSWPEMEVMFLKHKDELFANQRPTPSAIQSFQLSAKIFERQSERLSAPAPMKQCSGYICGHESFATAIAAVKRQEATTRLAPIDRLNRVHSSIREDLVNATFDCVEFRCVCRGILEAIRAIYSTEPPPSRSLHEDLQHLVLQGFGARCMMGVM